MIKKKMIQIDEKEYNELVKAKEELMKKGTEKLPNEIGDKIASFSLGAIIGAGAAMILHSLSQKEEESEKKRKKE